MKAVDEFNNNVVVLNEQNMFRNKTLLVLLEIVGGYTGIDRIYMGKFKTGLLKLSFFLILAGIYTWFYNKDAKGQTEVYESAWFIPISSIGTIVTIWYFIDAFSVFTNAFRRELFSPFSNRSIAFLPSNDVVFASYLSIFGVISLVSVAFRYFML